MSVDKPRILYVAENYRNEFGFIVLLSRDYEVTTAGEDLDILPAAHALELLRSGKEYDIIVTGMVLGVRGATELKTEKNGWDAGVRLLEVAREEGYKGKCIIHDTPAAFDGRKMPKYYSLSDGYKVLTVNRLTFDSSLRIDQAVAKVLSEENKDQPDTAPTDVPTSEPAGPS